jgi:predicted nucleotidyltransferase
VKTLDPTLLDEAVSRLAQAAPQATIILFGSRARGDAREGSDLDLLVVEPKVSSRRREMVRLTDILRPLRLPVDLLVVSRRTFQEWSDTPGTVIYQAAKEGKVLRAAA